MPLHGMAGNDQPTLRAKIGRAVAGTVAFGGYVGFRFWRHKISRLAKPREPERPIQDPKQLEKQREAMENAQCLETIQDLARKYNVQSESAQQDKAKLKEQINKLKIGNLNATLSAYLKDVEKPQMLYYCSHCWEHGGPEKCPNAAKWENYYSQRYIEEFMPKAFKFVLIPSEVEKYHHKERFGAQQAIAFRDHVISHLDQQRQIKKACEKYQTELQEKYLKDQTEHTRQNHQYKSMVARYRNGVKLAIGIGGVGAATLFWLRKK
jgi:hypothetical protein